MINKERNIKVCFVIDSLGGGGAEKVLVTIVNALCQAFDITILTLQSGGVLEKDLDSRIKLKSFDHFSLLPLKRTLYWINRHYLPVKLINNLYLNYKFDFYVAFLEGLSTKLVSDVKGRVGYRKYAWVHIDMVNKNWSRKFYKSINKQELAYKKFDKIFCVSKSVKNSVDSMFHCTEISNVQLNLLDTRNIKKQSEEKIFGFNRGSIFRIYSVGRLNSQKGYDRLIEVISKLKNEGYLLELWILGEGEERQGLELLIKRYNLQNCVFLYGYQENPYKFFQYCDLFVCSSRAEGYSTAITECMVLGKAIVSTKCSGVIEQLGENEYGIVVENTTAGIYEGIKLFLDNQHLIDKYEKKALIKGKEYEYERRLAEYEILFK